MEVRLHSLLLFLMTAMSLVDGKRILVLFYHPGPSHFSAFYPLFNTLAERGHNVTVLSYSHVKHPHKSYNELLLQGMDEINSSLTYDTMVNTYNHRHFIFVIGRCLQNTLLVLMIMIFGLVTCSLAFRLTSIATVGPFVVYNAHGIT